MTHSDLVEIAYKWVLKNGSCGVAFKELKALTNECADVIGFGSGGFSVLIEVKVSRSDFLADKKKSFRKNPEKGMGTERYYMCPQGLLKPEDMPVGWSLIYVNEKMKPKVFHRSTRMFSMEYNGTTWETNRTYQHEKNIIAEHALMYSALRRLHIKGHIDSIYDKQYVYGYKESSIHATQSPMTKDLFTENDT